MTSNNVLLDIDEKKKIPNKPQSDEEKKDFFLIKSQKCRWEISMAKKYLICSQEMREKEEKKKNNENNLIT